MQNIILGIDFTGHEKGLIKTAVFNDSEIRELL